MTDPKVAKGKSKAQLDDELETLRQGLLQKPKSKVLRDQLDRIREQD